MMPRRNVAVRTELRGDDRSPIWTAVSALLAACAHESILNSRVADSTCCGAPAARSSGAPDGRLLDRAERVQRAGVAHVSRPPDHRDQVAYIEAVLT